MLDPLKYITMPGALFEIFALVIALLSFFSMLIIRSYTIKKIKSRSETAWPHRQAHDWVYQNTVVRIAAGHWLRKLMYTACVVVIFFPLAAMGMNLLVNGEHPPIPDGELPVIRLSDIKPDSNTLNYASTGDGDTNTYESFPGILLTEHISLGEHSDSSWIYSDKYSAIWMWYTDLIAMGAREQALGDLIEYENPGKFGFDKIWYEPKMETIHYIVAQKGKSVYAVVYCNGDVTDQEILKAMQNKLES